MEINQEYFNFSQSVRKQIESSLLVQIIKHQLLNPYEKTRLIGEGSHNRIYRIGQLESGLWVAMRKQKSGLGGKSQLEHDLPDYEYYCREAQKCEYKTTSFCVPVVLNNEGCALLVEDSTEGGKYTIDEKHRRSDGELLSLDLDSPIFQRKKYELFYCAPENRINLT